MKRSQGGGKNDLTTEVTADIPMDTGPAEQALEQAALDQATKSAMNQATNSTFAPASPKASCSVVRNCQATPTQQQSPSSMPNIPLATSIKHLVPPLSCMTSLDCLFARQMSFDPYCSLAPLKRKLYGCPSMVERLQLERKLKEHEGCVNCINFSWSGRLLASGSDDLHVVLWDWARGCVVSKFDSRHVANVFQVRLSALPFRLFKF